MGRRGRLHDGAIIIIITITWCVHEINSTKKKRAYNVYNIIQNKDFVSVLRSIRSDDPLASDISHVYPPQ